MASITIHDIPDDLLEAVRRSAGARGRSVEEELKEAVRRLYARDRVGLVLANARSRWTTTEIPPERLEAWVDEGRP